ncbi:hypothetical protein K501DRAFT_285777 [Backusella circina FSU 941]|nr:hypothetical protein K501DRAFT_285777 [Backusella circina FSU 941]
MDLQVEDNKKIETKKLGRKPYDKPIDVSDPNFKRKAQNRAAQRAFRERKEKYITEMQEQINQLKQEKKEREDELLIENIRLKKEVESLKQENQHLRNAYNSRFDLNKIPPQPPIDTARQVEVKRLPSLFGNEVDLYSADNPALFANARVEQEEEEEPTNILQCAPENIKSCTGKVLAVLEKARGRRICQVRQQLKSYCPEFDFDVLCERLKGKVSVDTGHILTDKDVDIYIDFIEQT